MSVFICSLNKTYQGVSLPEWGVSITGITHNKNCHENCNYQTV